MVDLFPITLNKAEVRRKGKRLLGPIDHTLDAHGITVILGPNGAGKTTLLRVMHGVERLSSGRADWAVPTATAQSKQAYVFQTPIMLRRTGGENLRYPLKLAGLDKSTSLSLVADWAARIGLSDALGQRATRLSGGEKQKLAIARALITKPQVLFLDEPCANLDGASTREIEALLLSAHTQGTQIIMTTHDVGQMRRLGQHAMFMMHGNIVEHGPMTDLLNTPNTPQLRAYLAGDIVT